MKIFLALIILAILCQLQLAYYTTTTPPPYATTKDYNPEKIYEELIEEWKKPPPPLRKKINLTIPEYDVWTSLGKFVPTGKKIQTASVMRFCRCENPLYTPEKRSLVTRVKRQKQKHKKVVRKEWRTMSRSMKKAFIKHFNNLSIKRDNEPKSRLHLLADWHRNSEAPGAHGGPAFLPWHREYLFRLKNLLRDDGYEYGLPYWDSGLDYNLPTPAHSAIFTSSELGTSQGRLGKPFQRYSVSQDCIDSGLGRFVTRDTDGKHKDYLFHSTKKISLPWDDNYTTFSSDLETQHGGVHIFIGGHMRPLSCTGFEPLFYLHHTYIDYLWEEYRKGQSYRDRANDYPDTGVRLAHLKFITMKPFFDKENIDGMRNQYTNVFYRYEKSPTWCRNDTECNGTLLWCNRERCQAKIRVNGDCHERLGGKQCYCKDKDPSCRNGKCQCT